MSASALQKLCRSAGKTYTSPVCWFPYGAVTRLRGKLGPTAEVLLRLDEKFGKSTDWMPIGKIQSVELVFSAGAYLRCPPEDWNGGAQKGRGAVDGASFTDEKPRAVSVWICSCFLGRKMEGPGYYPLYSPLLRVLPFLRQCADGPRPRHATRPFFWS
jgi:hypothetical protein